MTDFSKWKVTHRELTPGEMVFLDKVFQLTIDQPFVSGRHTLLVHSPSVSVEVSVLRAPNQMKINLLNGVGWQCIWSKDHSFGTVHTILEQKFDTDLVLMRMCIS